MNPFCSTLAVLIALGSTGCGSGATGPSYPPCDTFDLSGSVTDDMWLLPGQPASSPIVGARVTIIAGREQGASTVTSAGGGFAFTNLIQPGERVLEASADGFETNSRGVALLGNAYQGSTRCTRVASIELGQEPHTAWGNVRQGGVQLFLLGARVEIIDGPNAGAVAFTDESSSFRIDGLRTSSAFRFRVSADGYDTAVVESQSLRRNTQYQFRLFRP